MRRFLIALTRDPLSLFGTAVTTASAIVFLSLFAIELTGHHGSPYIGILAYVILPTIFVLGLLLIPLGIIRTRRRAANPAIESRYTKFPVIDLNRPRTRGMALSFLGLTLVNVVLIATATYKGVEVMDSTEFCGTACHAVMAPEYTAYQRSPHARVKCVACHIGPGAGWFAKSKLSGAWQLVSVSLDLYPTPIPSPVHNLRPSRDTCEQCHWPTKFVGDQLRVKVHHDVDEANTPLTTALLLRVGGRQNVRSSGIHWHVDPGVTIRYRSDPSREAIGEVELTRADGSVTLFRPNGAAANGATAEGAGDIEREWRVMDCIDCHNRPTHVYRTPEHELDMALLDGRIDRALPFVKREGVRLLRETYASHDEANVEIRRGLEQFYREQQPDVLESQRTSIAAAAEELGRLYGYNVFPAMKVDWGTYPDHIGHESSPGCFRCHNDEHVSDDGAVISQDCSTCHELLAMEEESPEILSSLGL